MSDETKELDLTTVAKGAAPELFRYELEKVLRNIKDMNTGPGKRTIVMKFTFEPHQDREDSRSEMITSVEATSKLQPVLPVASFAFIQRKGDKLSASTHDVDQGELLDDGSSVLPMHRGA